MEGQGNHVYGLVTGVSHVHLAAGGLHSLGPGGASGRDAGSKAMFRLQTE